jgi:hypothetical protein
MGTRQSKRVSTEAVCTDSLPIGPEPLRVLNVDIRGLKVPKLFLVQI